MGEGEQASSSLPDYPGTDLAPAACEWVLIVAKSVHNSREIEDELMGWDSCPSQHLETTDGHLHPHRPSTRPVGDASVKDQPRSI